ncbi:zinc finger BED domain-containing protein 4-like [Huso huso]|uniref:Zinc finger BED domain-containing protein 4-like n=1 Tax=Huso huso TaxID=61971 RepID=A0ABR0ZUP6_HUSHU
MTEEGVVDFNNSHPFGEAVYAVAAVLDPAFSLQWLVDVNVEDEKKEVIRLKVKELVVMEAESVSGRNTFTSSTSEEDEDEPPHKYTKLFSSYKKRRPNNANKTAASQLIRYLELTEQAEDTSLNFWVSHKSKLNILYPLAKKVLAVPASSAPVERVFSRGDC